VTVLTRQTWKFYTIFGHTKTVLATAANPRMFFLPAKLLQQREQQAKEQALREGGEGAGGAGGGGGTRETEKEKEKEGGGGGGGADGSEGLEFSQYACNIFASGSNDRSIGVWTSNLARPMFHMTQVSAEFRKHWGV